MKLKTKTGRIQIFRAIELKVFPRDAAKPIKRTIRAAPGRAFDGKGVDEVLESAVELIEKDFPGQEFRMVQVGPAAFNFVSAPAEAAHG